MTARPSSPRWLKSGDNVWLFAALLLIVFAGGLSAFSHSFGLDTEIVEMPIWQLTILLCAAGGLYLGFCAILLRARAPEPNKLWSVVALIAVAGLAARLILFASEPTIEIDYWRYLWDGGVTAAGLNPYLTAPAEIQKLSIEHPLRQLAEDAGHIVQTIGHAQLTTIYPPVAQAAFAVAHWLEPWSLGTWRLVILLADIATFLLLLKLLQALAAPLTWSAIYWWNPLVLKELFNSAHMDVLIAPFVLLAIFASIKRRPLVATIAICLASGIKVWPVILLPLIWRPLIGNFRKLAGAATLAAFILVLLALPFLLAGLQHDAGIVAYTSNWRISAPLYGLIEMSVTTITSGNWPARSVARLLVAGLLVGLVIFLAYQPRQTPEDLVRHTILIVATLLFLSPAFYPWYATWLLPLLALRPHTGLLLLTVTAPLYYSRFYFSARGTYEVFELYIVWLLWVPVWIALAWHLVAASKFKRGTHRSSHS